MAVRVENNKLEKRFEAEVNGFLTFLDYELDEKTIIFIHTIVPSELEGQGLGSQLAKAALDYAEIQGLKVVPQCPFVARYMEKHKKGEVACSDRPSEPRG